MSEPEPTVTDLLVGVLDTPGKHLVIDHLGMRLVPDCPQPMKDIGSPPQPVEVWLDACAKDNRDAARRSLRPSTRRKYRGQAWAFEAAAQMVRQARPA